MRLKLQCITCFIKQAERAARLSSDDPDIQLESLRRANELLSKIDYNRTPPEIATDIFKEIKIITNNPDAYKELKDESNKLVKNIIEKLGESELDFTAALKLSLCGNIIDHGILDDFDVEKIVDEELKRQIDPEIVEKLKNIILSSKIIVFIADNAGEIGFDAILLREFVSLNPSIEIKILVKSTPLINDATIDDAKFFELEKDFELIEYPDSVGFKFDGMPEDIKALLDSADYIVSKGQANYEIIYDSYLKNVIFLLRAKCSVVSENIGVKEGSPVVLI